MKTCCAFLTVTALLLSITSITLSIWSAVQPDDNAAPGYAPAAAPGPAVIHAALPGWVTTNTNTQKRANWPEMQAVTRDKVAEASHPLDLLLLGDSITAFHRGVLVGGVQGTSDVWNKYFGDNNTLALGIPGDKIGNVAWRLIVGGEKPPIDPNMLVFLIGINDIGGSVKSANPDAAGRMDYLLEWVGANMPRSRVGVMATLPTTYHNYKALNGALRSVVATHNALWIECGQDINPTNTTLMADGIHPTAAGHDIILDCLRVFM